MNKIKETALNLSPFNNRTEMPKLLYILKVILIFYALSSEVRSSVKASP